MGLEVHPESQISHGDIVARKGDNVHSNDFKSCLDAVSQA